MRKITKEEWERLAVELCSRITKHYSGVFGVPRGGVPLAVFVSQKLNLELLEEPKLNCIVVDDLIDSGRTREKYKQYDFEVLIDKRTPKWKGQWIEFWYENSQQDAEDIVIRQLEFIGENPQRQGLKDTPKRVVNMWKELFRGYNENEKPKITTFNNGEDGIIYDQMVIDEGNFYSHCEHHTCPFFGNYYFGVIYNTKGKVLGLSKVARVVDYFSARLQVQERLVRNVVDYLWNKLSKEGIEPLGMGLVMKGEHLCKTMRGVKKKGLMTTSELRGVFRDDNAVRSEFMNFVK